MVAFALHFPCYCDYSCQVCTIFRCGVVALSMVGSLASPPVDPDYVLAKAISHGFTTKGEIFSAQTMLRLAQLVYPEHSAAIMEVSIDSAERLCSGVIHGGIILLPYVFFRICGFV